MADRQGGRRPQRGLVLRQGQAPRSCDLETFLRGENMNELYQGSFGKPSHGIGLLTNRASRLSWLPRMSQ